MKHILKRRTILDLKRQKIGNAKSNKNNSRHTFLKNEDTSVFTLAITNFLTLFANEMFGSEELKENAPCYRNISRLELLNKI